MQLAFVVQAIGHLNVTSDMGASTTQEELIFETQVLANIPLTVFVLLSIS